MNGKTSLPNNLEAEQALLGCLLMDNETQNEVLESLEEEDFYQPSHRLILGAMRRVYTARHAVDTVTLADELDRGNSLENAGGLSYITELVGALPSAANYRAYFTIVKRDSVNRKLIRAAQQITETCRENPDAEESVMTAEKLVFDISKQTDTSTLVDMREDTAYTDVLDKFDTIARDKDSLRGVLSGFTKLDDITNGFQKSDLIVLAARPGVGKTALGMNIVEHAAVVGGKSCAVFSLEMPRNQLAQRLLCAHARVSMSDALSGKLEGADWKKLWKAQDDLRRAKIFIDDSSKITVAQILSKCRRLKARSGAGLDLVMVDYIQLMESGSRKREENRQQEISTITRNLKIMAKELEVPVIALSQLRRISGKEEPQLSDLRESGAIEQDADIVLFIHRPDLGASEEDFSSGRVKKDEADLIIAKHRNGRTGKVKLRFRGDQVRYVNPPPEYVPDEPHRNAPPGKREGDGEADAGPAPGYVPEDIPDPALDFEEEYEYGDDPE